MDLTVRTETFGAGNLSWLGSREGLVRKTGTIQRSSLTKATHFPDNTLRSSFALAKVSGKLVPYNSAGSGGTNILYGFLFTDQQVLDNGGDIVAPIVRQGDINLAKMHSTSPVVAADATTTGKFTFN